MAYRFCSSLSLGPASTGLTLKAQLLNSDGTANGSEITGGFYEVGGGNYLWNYAAVPDGFHGGVRYYTGTAPGMLRGVEAISPSMAAPANWTALAIGTNGVVRSNLKEVNEVAYDAVAEVDVSSESADAIAEAAAAAVLTDPANKLATDDDGRVTATNGGGGGQLDPNGLDQIEIEDGINLRQSLAAILAACAGRVSGAGTGGPIVFKDPAGVNIRITATVGTDGDRPTITLSLPS